MTDSMSVPQRILALRSIFSSNRAYRAFEERFDGMIAMRRATVDTFVVRRFAELAAQGHGPQRHEGAVTRQMLVDRVLHGVDPMTGTRVDGVTGRLHTAVRSATKITSEADYVAAEVFIRRSPDYNHAREDAISRIGQRPTTRFEVAMPLDEVAHSVEGVSRLGSVRNPTGIRSVDFSGGRLVAVFELNPDGEPLLVTMFPMGVRQ